MLENLSPCPKFKDPYNIRALKCLRLKIKILDSPLRQFNGSDDIDITSFSKIWLKFAVFKMFSLPANENC